MSSSEQTGIKSSIFGALLEQGIVSLHLNAGGPGVRVPEWLRDRGWLVLNFSLRYRLEDFSWDEEGVFASLSFSGRPYPCQIPWSAVFGVTNESQDQGRFWYEELPASIADVLSQRLQELSEEPARASASKVEPAPAPKIKAAPAPKVELAPALKVESTGDKIVGLKAIEGGGSALPSAPRRGHLRRIK